MLKDTNNNLNCLVKIKGVPTDFNKLPFGHKINYTQAISDWKNTAESTYVDCKGKATLSSVKKFLKEIKATEYFARWEKDSSFYKEDSVFVFYKL